MSTTVRGGPAEVAPAEVSPAARGRLTISRKVVEKTAAQVAHDTAVVGGRSGGVLGVARHLDLDARPHADVHVSGDSAAISLRVSVGYPMSLRTVTERVRDQVRDRVEHLTGLSITRVDIEIVAVGTADAPERRLR